MRRHYVYYRVPAAELPAMVREVQAWHAVLRQRHPGLQAELLQRPELREGQATLMEVCGPLDPRLAEAIEHEASARWPALQRHVEVFDLLG